VESRCPVSVRRAVILVGSAKPAGTSTSESLSRDLGAALEHGGAGVAIVPVVTTKTEAGMANLAAQVEAADVFVLVSPLYVDSLPYLVTRVLEAFAPRAPGAGRCAFASIVNCGFPEPVHCRTAIDIARVFARRAGFEWAGGLALGEGGMIDGRLEALGALGRHVRRALDLAAVALLEERAIPVEAVKLMARPLVPARLYTLVGDYGWKRQARRNGVGRQLRARPFNYFE
jgi:hypothetical protein